MFITKWSLQAQKFTFQLAVALAGWQLIWETIKGLVPPYWQTVGNTVIAVAIIIAGNIPQPKLAEKINENIAEKANNSV